jgi:hypothetical protein
LADGHENADGGTGQLGSAVTAIIYNSIDLFLNPIHHSPESAICNPKLGTRPEGGESEGQIRNPKSQAPNYK